MENVSSLIAGFSVIFGGSSILFLVLGVALGITVGALPGLGPSAGIAVLLPLIFGMDPISAMAMLAAIYYGAMFGGAISSILINTPGDAAAVMTTLDGHPMAQQGRAGAAMGMATIASFVGGTIGIIALTFIAPTIAEFALNFGPPEYFALIIFALITLIGLVGKSPAKGMVMVVVGLLLSTVGMDIMTGKPRFTFGSFSLLEGIEFIPVVMGLFGLAEVLKNFEKEAMYKMVNAKINLRNLFPSLKEFLECKWTLLRGSVLGFFIGVLPGAGATIASFISYSLAKQSSKNKDKFGKGAIEGVAAPEVANNAASTGAMVPLLTLGIPGSGATAMLLGALMILGLRPGPLLFDKNPEFVWAVIASMYIGNLVLIILTPAFIPTFSSILRVPNSILMPGIATILIVGVYSFRLMMSDVWIMLIFGVLGYVLSKLDYPSAPLVLGLVLGPLAEFSMRQSLQLSHGSMAVFYSSPISAILLVVAALILIKPLLTGVYKRLKA